MTIGNEAPCRWQFGPFQLQRDERRLLRGGEVVPLRPRAFEVLEFLLLRAGRLVTKDDLLGPSGPSNSVFEAELRGHGLCQVLELPPLTEEEMQTLVRRRRPDLSAETPQVERWLRRCGGNPLFLNALVGADVAERPHPAGLPAGVRELIERQLESEGEEARRLLEGASVLGESWELEPLSRALGVAAVQLEARCAALAGRGASVLGGEGGRYRFRHGLVREVLYAGLTPGVRQRLHRRLGQELQGLAEEGRAVPQATLAVHFDQGGEPAHAVRAYLRAARVALDRHAYREVIALARRALELLATLPRLLLIEGRRWALREADRAAARPRLEEAHRVAREQGSRSFALAAALELARLPATGGEAEKSRHRLARAVAEWPTGEETAMVREARDLLSGSREP